MQVVGVASQSLTLISITLNLPDLQNCLLFHLLQSIKSAMLQVCLSLSEIVLLSLLNEGNFRLTKLIILDGKVCDSAIQLMEFLPSPYSEVLRFEFDSIQLTLEPSDFVIR